MYMLYYFFQLFQFTFVSFFYFCLRTTMSLTTFYSPIRCCHTTTFLSHQGSSLAERFSVKNTFSSFECFLRYNPSELHCKFRSKVARADCFLFIFLSVITGGSQIFIYAIYYFLFKKEQCPICGGKDLRKRQNI